MHIKTDRKIFCIGFNKTGTTSLHRYFGKLGFKSIHNTIWPLASQVAVRRKEARDVQSIFRDNTCFSDGEFPDFQYLDQTYEDSVFILNTRNLRDWIHSRVKHALGPGLQPLHVRFDHTQTDWFNREYYNDEGLVIDKWIYERAYYHTAVRRYFSDRVDFLEIDVTTDQAWNTKIRDFLSDNGFKNLPNVHAIHVNKSDMKKMESLQELQRNLKIADERLRKYEQTQMKKFSILNLFAKRLVD